MLSELIELDLFHYIFELNLFLFVLLAALMAYLEPLISKRCQTNSEQLLDYVKNHFRNNPALQKTHYIRIIFFQPAKMQDKSLKWPTIEKIPDYSKLISSMDSSLYDNPEFKKIDFHNPVHLMGWINYLATQVQDIEVKRSANALLNNSDFIDLFTENRKSILSTSSGFSKKDIYPFMLLIVVIVMSFLGNKYQYNLYHNYPGYFILLFVAVNVVNIFAMYGIYSVILKIKSDLVKFDILTFQRGQPSLHPLGRKMKYQKKPDDLNLTDERIPLLFRVITKTLSILFAAIIGFVLGLIVSSDFARPPTFDENANVQIIVSIVLFSLFALLIPMKTIYHNVLLFIERHSTLFNVLIFVTIPIFMLAYKYILRFITELFLGNID